MSVKKSPRPKKTSSSAPSKSSFTYTKNVSADGTISGTFSFTPSGDMMESEGSVLDLVQKLLRENVGSILATDGQDGRPILGGEGKFNSGDQSPQISQTSAGSVSVESSVLPALKGDGTGVPLENKTNKANKANKAGKAYKANLARD
ncbi:MAG: hypothetical protein LBT86_09140 [Deltaproteobacteria bacterium]|jgi:hypothetical protein|nr:hypothetical protein [Deltaproteobacteria bacterium]